MTRHRCLPLLLALLFMGADSSGAQVSRPAARPADLDDAARRAEAERRATTGDTEEASRAYDADTSFDSDGKADFDSPENSEQILLQLLMLTDRIMQTQVRMVSTLNDSLERFSASSDGEAMTLEERRRAVQQALLFNQQMKHLGRQLPHLERSLALYAQDLPGHALSEVTRRRELIERNQAHLAEKHRALVALFKTEKGRDADLDEDVEKLEKDPPPDEFDPGSDPAADAPKTPGGVHAAVPETTAGAAALLEYGQVPTPDRLTELFERVPTQETPSGTLERYRDFLR